MSRLLPHGALDHPGRIPGLWLRAAVLAAAAVVLAAGVAPGGSHSSSNVLTLQESIAGHSRDLAQLLDQTNAQMTTLQTDMTVIGGLDDRMRTLAAQTGQLSASTDDVGTRLGSVQVRIGAQGRALRRISRQVRRLGVRMGAMQGSVAGQLAMTRGMSANFASVSSDMRAMTRDFAALIHQMGASVPKVSLFSTNALQTSYPGGDSSKYAALNLLPDTRVMSIMLPMITTLQSGGDLIGDKVAQTADSSLVGNLLAASVPDGTNVVSKVLPYDGRYGLPSATWFLGHRVGGF
jgi:hypothetical protein